MNVQLAKSAASNYTSDDITKQAIYNNATNISNAAFELIKGQQVETSDSRWPNFVLSYLSL